VSSTAVLPAPPVEGRGDRLSLLRPGIADLVFLFMAVVALRGAAQGLLDDPGLGWHLRNIDAIRAEGWWLRADPFTDPCGGEPVAWYSNQWLGELPLYLGWRLAGLEGIAVVCALVIALVARCLYRMLINDGLPWPLAVAWTALGALGTSCSWVARPNLFMVLFVLLTARVLEQYHRGRLSHRATLWLLPLFAAWANMHGGFLAGFILLGLALAVEAILAVGSFVPEERRAARGRALHLVLLCGGAFLATLLNPYGVGLYRWTLQLLGDAYFMTLHQEWKPPPFQAAGAMRYELLMLLFPLVLAASRRRPGLLELVTAVAWLHLALTGFRYVALWVVVAVPVMARSSLDIPYLQELARRWQLTAQPGSLFFTRQGSAGWLWSALLAVGLLAVGCALEGRVARHKQEIIASEALDRFLVEIETWRDRHGRRPVIFHSYDWGGYLTWHGWPGVLNWIDDRNEVQGQARVKEFFAIRDAEPGWEWKLRNVDLICIESGARLTSCLSSRPDTWRELYRNDQAVIFEHLRWHTDGRRGRGQK
jgi:hypothetical protein